MKRAKSRRQVDRVQQLCRPTRAGALGVGQAGCAHEWERDGQTLTAVRWYCRKCGASQFT